jgi:hypothetical protein
MSQNKISRRKFLGNATAAAAAPLILPACLHTRGTGVPPSERINIAGIGLRSRGFHDLQWLMSRDGVQFVAICDVQQRERERIKAHVDGEYGNTDCAMYMDMREMLERDDIDAVLIATGDRWHAPASIMAMRAGKDVFTEKPSHDHRRRPGRGRDGEKTPPHLPDRHPTPQRIQPRVLHEMVRSGRMGDVHTAYAHIAPWDTAKMTRNILPAQEQPPKEVVDWDAWLGPCPWREYNEAYMRGGWRGDYDFHTSCIGEWGAHTFAQAQAGLELDDTSPVKYEYVDNDSGDGMICTFANGKKLILSRGDHLLARPLRRTLRQRTRLGRRRRRLHKSRSVLGRIARRLQPRNRRIRPKNRPITRPHARLPRLRTIPKTTRRQPKHDAPLHDHRTLRKHRHVARTRRPIRSQKRTLHKRRRSQRAALARTAGTVGRDLRRTEMSKRGGDSLMPESS